MSLDPAAFSGMQYNPDEQASTRYVQPPRVREVPDHQLRYEDAKKLANDITLVPGFYGIAIISGSFIFGDFIEALIVERKLYAQELTISTLSMSQNNVDSLAGLIEGGYIGKLNLTVSDYFYSHERHELIPYIYEKLDVYPDVFQLAVAGTHCKYCLLETSHGNKIVVHGSANLRSSGNVEQICIEENPAAYALFMESSRNILTKFATINHQQPHKNLKPLRHQKLWQQVVAAVAVAE